MSLLWFDHETEFQDLVDTSFQYEHDDNPDYFSDMSKRVQDIIYRDTKYNIDFLYTSYVLNDDKIMSDYAAWLFHLMFSVLPKDREETARYVNNHFEYIKKAIVDVISPEKHDALIRLLDEAKQAILKEAKSGEIFFGGDSKYETQIEQYMDSLSKKNMKRSIYLIQQFIKDGISINDIYVEILAESMRRIGELWHTARISVDQEHYSTTVTQMAMAQMYPLLFSNENRKDKTMLCACPGTELHEIGARMVSDLFENDGWDTIYLGAAVPQHAMLKAIASDRPDLICLSVTMPQHLIACHELILAIREQFPEAKIAVGGKAFESTHDLWKQWPVDIYARDAIELLEKANSI